MVGEEKYVKSILIDRERIGERAISTLLNISGGNVRAVMC